MPSFSRSRIAARVQDEVSRRREDAGLYREIAERLPLADTGRLLDVGTGSGLQLRAIHAKQPNLELFGLDVSSAAIRVARANLVDHEVDLRQGSIEHTSYDDDMFDIVTCHSSMSYWKDPIACLDEIHRILKPGGSAILFEPHKDIDIDGAVDILRKNLADKSRLRRFMAVGLNKLGLRWGRRIGLRLHSIAELEALAAASKFGQGYSVERISLLNLPIFARITLAKSSRDSRRS